jgi:hypothetical protein
LYANRVFPGKEGKMSRKTAIYLALLATLHFTMGCAAKRVFGPGGKVSELPPAFFEAKAFPEIQLQLKESLGSRAGKITGMENRLVRFLPAPYWNVETLRIDLSEISSIVLPGKKGAATRAGVLGFGYGFLMSGGFAAAVSKYDQDYQAGLILAPIGGLTGGLLAMAISALSGSGKEIRYELSSMSDEEKTFVILKLMGLRQ